ncbi:MAG: electron transfer flavoprotein subunit alpha/FixB family protein [Pirellulaceae bacterium]
MSCLLPGMELDRATIGLVAEAERIARQLSVEHVVVASGVPDELLQHATRQADRVVVLPTKEPGDYQIEPCLAALHTVGAELKPRLVLLGQDTYSQEIAPRLAHRLQGCSIGDAQRIEIRDEKIHVTRGVYGGKAIAVVRANVEPAVVWTRSRAFAAESERSAACQVEHHEGGTDDSSGSEIIERSREATSGVRLEDAQVIVSGGRGLGGPEPFAELGELAKSMKAEVAASRAACDAGWVSPSLQVGQTGKKVAPELYLAIAISGASQHLMGIADAKVVAAINTDADAPIFRHCQFGLVEDFRQVIGPLKKQIEESNG